MAMESYFVSLLEMSGAEEIVLLRDGASSICLLLGEDKKKDKKKDMMFRRTASLSSYGPPSRPLRKASSENLHVARAGNNRSKKTPSKKPNALKDFFDEVAPGLRPRPKKSRQRNKTNNKNWASQKHKEGGPSPADSLLFKSNSKSLLRNVFSDVVQSHDDHRTQRSHEPHAAKVHLKGCLEEVEFVVGGRRTSRKEARWT
jgi:hypothetical protein